MPYYMDGAFVSEAAVLTYLDIAAGYGTGQPSGRYDLPYKHIILSGDGGDSKTNMIGLTQCMRDVTYVCSTNEAGGNLERNLNRSSVFYKDCKKNSFPTVCRLFGTDVPDMEYLYKAVYARVLEAFKNVSSFDTMNDYWRAHRYGFVAMANYLWTKHTYDTQPFNPTVFAAIRARVRSTHQDATREETYDRVMEIAASEWSVPVQLTTTTYCIDEVGRIPYYIVMFMVMFHDYVHVKFDTGLTAVVMPNVICVGSPTQSRVVHGHSDTNPHVSISALTVIRHRFFADLPTERIYIKQFKYNRRITAGDMENSIAMSTVVKKLESGAPVEEDLSARFHDQFVVPTTEFFKPPANSDNPRLHMGKRWCDIKRVYAHISTDHARNTVYVSEFVTSCYSGSDMPVELLYANESIDVKMSGESYTKDKQGYTLKRGRYIGIRTLARTRPTRSCTRRRGGL